MQQNIWSSPQVGGSGGALKALARNVANHLKLNRTSMKRVVAQVVAEHHTLGEVADYKGHMYFAKPDRLNFQELIAQSKEAFDDLVLHEPRLGRNRGNHLRPRNTYNSKVHLQMKVSPPQLKMPAKKSLSARKLTSVKKAKNELRRKCSTTIFQLADAGRRSLNGVIIDDTHLPPNGERREILLHVPSAHAKRPRRRQPLTKPAPQAKDQKSRPSLNRIPKAEMEMEPKLQAQKSNQKQLKRPRPSKILKQREEKKSHGEPKNQQNNLQPRSPTSKGSPSPTTSLQKEASSVQKIGQPLRPRKSQRKISARRNASFQRIKAGNSTQNHQPVVHHPVKSYLVKRTQTRSKWRPLKKKIPLLHRTYEKPWLIRRTKRRRLSGGSHGHKLQKKESQAKAIKKLDKIDVEWVEKSDREKTEQSSPRSAAKVEKGKSAGKLKPKRITHVARQMRNVSFPWYTPYQFQGAAGATQRPSAGAGVPPYQLLKEKTRKLSQRLAVTQPMPHQMRRGQNFTSRQRHNRRMQERLMRDLQREEAIDEPLSHGSGVFRRSRGGWQQQQPQKLTIREMEKPGKSEKPKQIKEHRSVERVSSRTKRLVKQDNRRRQPTNASMVPSSPRRITITVNKNSPSRSLSSPRIRRRNRSVPVDSSLGSIALMGQPQQSKHTLTPAKRHLTIAFMDKRSERTNPATQMWK
ncbi:uncharacterized protein LOC108095360 [Drosophila ficusphila]|uniref:uncharacterized protein LOC108095360 n=1 Tax=Drosophila ficusphila TaxID=30025 RepID=UPI0007E7288B|nr:uncharacterized protein LOC108095360 [Drosophila ficusphila]